MKRFTKAIAAIMLMTATVVLTTRCSNNSTNSQKSNDTTTTEVEQQQDLETHDYVDLGLPSGTLWATCNVGANAPDKYGDYFAWGETKTKSVYTWDNYKYCKGSGDQLTKYNVNSDFGYNGFADELTTLKPEDDAATANWGDGWRTPTKDQWEELQDNTTNQWTTQNGVNGWLFTSKKNDQSLFLPAAGLRWGWVDELDDAGSRGYYWSSSLNTDYPNDAWSFYFDSGNYDMGYGDRFFGFTVRPVYSSPQN